MLFKATFFINKRYKALIALSNEGFVLKTNFYLSEGELGFFKLSRYQHQSDEGVRLMVMAILF